MDSHTLKNLLNVLPKDAREIIIKDRQGDEAFFTSATIIMPGAIFQAVQQKFVVRNAPNGVIGGQPTYSGYRYAVKELK